MYFGWFLKMDTCIRIRLFFLARQYCMYDYGTANIIWNFNDTVFCYSINSHRRTQLSRYTLYPWWALEPLQRVTWPSSSAVWWLGKRSVAGHVLFRALEWSGLLARYIAQRKNTVATRPMCFNFCRLYYPFSHQADTTPVFGSYLLNYLSTLN
jgi:hypothetical protein